jgi:hypothetical protein
MVFSSGGVYGFSCSGNRPCSDSSLTSKEEARADARVISCVSSTYNSCPIHSIMSHYFWSKLGSMFSEQYVKTFLSQSLSLKGRSKFTRQFRIKQCLISREIELPLRMGRFLESKPFLKTDASFIRPLAVSTWSVTVASRDVSKIRQFGLGFNSMMRLAYI